MYLLGQGETLNRTEATEVFFAVTKLWQSKDVGIKKLLNHLPVRILNLKNAFQPTLRRLVYLAIKEMSSMADDVIIVTSR